MIAIQKTKRFQYIRVQIHNLNLIIIKTHKNCGYNGNLSEYKMPANSDLCSLTIAGKNTKIGMYKKAVDNPE